jgi:transcriptional regulator with XRE-family HTH domain
MGESKMEDAWAGQMHALGEFIRTQRSLARMSLRELAGLTDISNAYLSQVERGLHEPSVRVLKAIAEALDLSSATLLAQAGLLRDGEARPEGASVERTEATIRADPTLSEDQKEALLAVYRSYSTGSGSE